jgi:hypothetical protein
VQAPNGPWWLRVLSNPQTLANVVAFGAALLLLYTAAVEWPRQANRFYQILEEGRDVGRENQRLLREGEKQQHRREEMITEFRLALKELQTELKRLKEKEK